MLKWPEKARRSISTFFVKWNDFDVYVEDTAKHANSIYTAFITRVADGNCKVDKVIPLGGRPCKIQFKPTPSADLSLAVV